MKNFLKKFDFGKISSLNCDSIMLHKIVDFYKKMEYY